MSFVNIYDFLSPTTLPEQKPSPNDVLAKSLQHVLWTDPALKNSPDLAHAAATSDDPMDTVHGIAGLKMTAGMANTVAHWNGLLANTDIGQKVSNDPLYQELMKRTHAAGFGVPGVQDMKTGSAYVAQAYGSQALALPGQIIKRDTGQTKPMADTYGAITGTMDLVKGIKQSLVNNALSFYDPEKYGNSLLTRSSQMLEPLSIHDMLHPSVLWDHPGDIAKRWAEAPLNTLGEVGKTVQGTFGSAQQLAKAFSQAVREGGIDYAVSKILLPQVLSAILTHHISGVAGLGAAETSATAGNLFRNAAKAGNPVDGVADESAIRDALIANVKERMDSAKANVTDQVTSDGSATHAGNIATAMQQIVGDSFDNLGLNKIRGYRKIGLSSEELATQMKDAFSEWEKANPEVPISESVKDYIKGHFEDVADQIKKNQDHKQDFRAGKYVPYQALRLTAKVTAPIFHAMAALAAPEVGGSVIGGKLAAEQDQPFWKEAQAQESAGSQLSQALGLGKNSVLSASTNFILSMADPVFMFGRGAAVGDKILTEKTLDSAWSNSPRYRNALRFMQGKTSEQIQQTFKEIPKNLADEIGKSNGSTSEIHQVFKDFANADDIMQPGRVPRLGLYGQIRAASKLSDNEFLQFISKTFAQLPVVFTKEGVQLATKFSIDDSNVVGALGQMLTAMGFTERAVNLALENVSKEIANGSRHGLENALRNASIQNIFDVLDKRLFDEVAGSPMKIISDLKAGESRIARHLQAQKEVARLRKQIDDLETGNLSAAERRQLQNKLQKQIDNIQEFNVKFAPKEGETIPMSSENAAKVAFMENHLYSLRKSLELIQNNENLRSTVALKKWLNDTIAVNRENDVFLKNDERKALQEMLDHSAKMIEAHRPMYDQVRKAVTEGVEKMFGTSGSAGAAHAFGNDVFGTSKPILTQDGLKDAAIGFNQRGDLQLLNYRDFNRQMRELVGTIIGDISKGSEIKAKELKADISALWGRHAAAAGDNVLREEIAKQIKYKESLLKSLGENPVKHGAEFRNSAASKFYTASDLYNYWVNDKIFKPLALTTPGWAMRVSASELGINLARLGPLNIAAGLTSANLTRQIGKAMAKADAKADAKNAAEILSLRDKIDEYAARTVPLNATERAARDALTKRLREIGGKATERDIEKELWAIMDAEAADKAIPPAARSMMTTDGVQEVLRGYNLRDVPRAVARSIAMFARGALAGLDEGFLKVIGKEDFIRAAIMLAHDHETYLPNAVNSIHNYMPEGDKKTIPGSIKVAEKRKIGKGGPKFSKMKSQVYSGQYDHIGFGNDGYWNAWMHSANTWSGDDIFLHKLAAAYREHVDNFLEGQALHDATVQSAKDILNSIPENELATMDRSVFTSAPRPGSVLTNAALDDWAHTATQTLESVVRGQGIDGKGFDGILHRGLLDAIVERKVPTDLKTFVNRHALDKNGKLFTREKLAQSHVGPTIRTPEKLDFISTITSTSHDKLLGPIINHVVRQPTFIAEYVAMRRDLEDMVDKKILTPDQADLLAKQGAAQNMVKYIHNPLDKTRWEDKMRVVAPFYFAKNQAYRRMGRLFASNPGAFMQYTAAMLGVVNWAAEVSKQRGMTVWGIPASTLLFGLPLTAGLSALETIDPFGSPDVLQQGAQTGKLNPLTMLEGALKPIFGPTVAIPFKAAAEAPGIRNLPYRHEVETATIGQVATDTPLVRQFIPNSILNATLQFAAYKLGYQNRSFNAPMLQAQQEAQNKVAINMAEAKYTQLRKTESKADADYDIQIYLADMFQPGSKINKQLMQDANFLTTQIGIKKILLTMSLPVSIGIGQVDPNGAREQLAKLMSAPKDPKNPFGAINKFETQFPYYAPLEVGSSQSLYGISIPPTKAVMNEIDANPGLFKNYSLAGWAFVSSIKGHEKDPFYYPAYKAELDAGMRSRMTPEETRNHLSVIVGNQWLYNNIKPREAEFLKQGYSNGEIYQWEQQKIKEYSVHNPDWSQWFRGRVKDTQKLSAYDELKSAMNDPSIKQQYPKITSALEIFDKNWLPVLQKYQATVSSGHAGYKMSDVRDWWQNEKIPELIQKHPELAPAAYTILINLA